MATADQNFRPLTYLKLSQISGEGNTYKLYTAVYLPATHTVISSGYGDDGADKVYIIYVQEKQPADLGTLPMPTINFEQVPDDQSSELNWRTTVFEAVPSSINLITQVIEVNPNGTYTVKGKSKIVLADADDTDIDTI